MRWLTFTILAVIMLVLQTAAAPHLALAGVQPDWMFILATFYALLGPWPDVGIAAWTLGLLVDLQTAGGAGRGQIGLAAFAYGGAVWLVHLFRELVFREHWLAHLVTTLIGALLVQSVVAVYRTVTAPPGPGPATGYWSFAFWTALYTAFWSPYFHFVLIRLGRAMGLRPAGGRRRQPG